jgi:hypothetical protein
MKELRELVLVIENNGCSAASLFNGGTNTTSKLSSFYKGISQSRWDSDDNAARALYPGDKSPSSYRKLKSDLKERLLDSILSLKFNKQKYNSYQKAYYKSHRDWAVAKILLGQNANEAAADIATRLLRQARLFDFSGLAMDICSVLRLYYGARMGDMTRFEEYNLLFAQYQEIYQFENRAEEFYIILSSGFVNNKSSKEDIRDKATLFFQQLQPALNKYAAHRLHFYGALIELACYTSVNEYAAALKVCERYIQFFLSKEYEAHVPLQILYYQELLCHVQLKDFSAGRIAAENCCKLLAEGSYNWFKYQESVFLLAMHTNEFHSAFEIYHSVHSNRHFNLLPDNVKEIWKIFEAYLAYLIHLQLIQPDCHGGQKQFKLSKFQNETPVFSKDKKGMNIAILIAQFLLLLSEGKKSRFIDKVESIEQYSYKYLRTDHTLRSHYFIKILLQIPLSGFNKAIFLAKTSGYLEKMSAVPMESANQTNEIEIIPFEELYHLLTKQLS